MHVHKACVDGGGDACSAAASGMGGSACARIAASPHAEDPQTKEPPISNFWEIINSL